MLKRSVTKYSEDFKKSSAVLAMESEKSINQMAKELGVSGSTFHGWVVKYYSNYKEQSHQVEQDELLAELKQLRKENAQLKQEKAILKKAEVYFASETV